MLRYHFEGLFSKTLLEGWGGGEGGDGADVVGTMAEKVPLRSAYAAALAGTSVASRKRKKGVAAAGAEVGVAAAGPETGAAAGPGAGAGAAGVDVAAGPTGEPLHTTVTPGFTDCIDYVFVNARVGVVGAVRPGRCFSPRHRISLNWPISVYRFPRRALTLCPKLCMGIQSGARFPAPSADALPATMYGYFTQAMYRNRPICSPRHVISLN